MQNGRDLAPHEKADATLAGVRQPQRIKICVVRNIPSPTKGTLGEANRLLKLITDQTAGLTLNYGLFIRNDCLEDSPLLFHEFVHVAQYERLGGFQGFLPCYLQQCVTFEYKNAPLELEAVRAAKNYRCSR